MSVKYCAISAAYSKNSGTEGDISKRSSQCACTRGGTAWRASPSAFARKAPQKGLQEEEVEHGTFRTALPQASGKMDTPSGVMRGDDAHFGAAAKGLEELDELLRGPHVAQEESWCRMRGCVEGLGDIQGQNMILLLSPLQSALCQKHWSRRC